MAQNPTPPPRPYPPAQTRPARKAAPPLGRAVDKLLRPIVKRYGAPQAILDRHWAEIVGPDIHALAPGAILRQGVLTIKTRGGGALNLQYRANDIVARVNMHLGDGAVKRVAFLQTE